MKFATLFITITCIIFVDFPAFPTEHPKVSHNLVNIDDKFVALNYLTSFEEQKTFISLMDVGASLFVVLNGFFPHTLKKEFISMVLNFFLYFIRKFSTQSIGYYSPEGEYSKGCNFFGYIGMVYFVSSIKELFKFRADFIAIFFCIIHEILKCKYPILGYCCVFFISSTFHPRLIEKQHSILLLLFFFVFLFCEIGWLFPLRETSNASFNLYIIVMSAFAVLSHSKIGGDINAFSLFYTAIDKHNLIHFLFANILTGVSNIFLDLNHASFSICFIIVNSVFILSSILTILFHEVQQKVIQSRNSSKSEIKMVKK